MYSFTFSYLHKVTGAELFLTVEADDYDTAHQMALDEVGMIAEDCYVELMSSTEPAYTEPFNEEPPRPWEL